MKRDLFYRKGQGAKQHNMILFTLVELLVVIAIIAILASMLLPSLRKAKAMSKSIACLGNLKQVAIASHGYEGDYDGYMPCSRAVGSNMNNFGIYSHQLFPYIKNGVITNKDMLEYNVFQCPADPAPYYDCGYNLSFVCNINGMFYASLTSLNKVPYKGRTIVKPAQFLSMIDGTCSAFSPNLTDSWYNAIYSSIDFRHLNGANNIFYDGHGKRLVYPYERAKDMPFRWTRTGVRYE